MPVIITEMPTPYEDKPTRIRWTRQQCDTIREAGILVGRYELIEGEILTKMGQNPPHRIAVLLLRNWLIVVFGALFVQDQATIEVGAADPEHNTPEPDVAVTLLPNTTYLDRHPGPEDLVLVAEVSDTTLRFDRSTKAALYARAGIQDYWIVDVTGRQIFVHRHPTPEGYQEIIAYAENEELSPLARPDASVSVAALLPPLA